MATYFLNNGGHLVSPTLFVRVPVENSIGFLVTLQRILLLVRSFNATDTAHGDFDVPSF